MEGRNLNFIQPPIRRAFATAVVLVLGALCVQWVLELWFAETSALPLLLAATAAAGWFNGPRTAGATALAGYLSVRWLQGPEGSPWFAAPVAWGELASFALAAALIIGMGSRRHGRAAMPELPPDLQNDLPVRHAQQTKALSETAEWTWVIREDLLRCDERTRQMAKLDADAAQTPAGLQRLLARVHEADRPNLEAFMQSVAATEDSRSLSTEFRFEATGDADAPWVRLQCQRLPDAAGQGRGPCVIASMLDVSALRSARDALAQSERRHDRFMATMAHELRNPLAPLRNGLHLLRLMLAGDTGGAAGAAAGKPLAIMDRQLTHLTRLIDDLLQAARLKSGRLELQRHRVDLSEVVHDALEATRFAFQEAGHAFSLALPAHAVLVQADPTRLCQIFSDLLHTAARCTPRGGRVRLSVEFQRLGWVDICVENDGRGLAPGQLASLFEGAGADNSISTPWMGKLGWGLSIARQLVELHGGQLTGHSRDEGLGSRFTVRLPMAEDQEGAVTPERCFPPAVQRLWQTGGDSAPACRVIIADDDAEVAESLRALLHWLGCDTVVAADGFQALSLAQTHLPHLALLDLGMPGLDGHALARTWRAAPISPATTLIALTAWNDPATLEASKAAGFDLHWVKPVDLSRLCALVEQVQETAHAANSSTSHATSEAPSA